MIKIGEYDYTLIDGLSLVQFDLSSLYNSSKFMECSDLSLVLPITMVAAFSTSTAGTFVAPTAGNVNSLSLKNNFIHLNSSSRINYKR